MFLYVAAQFAAVGKAFEASFSAIDYRHGVLIGAAIVLVYTVSGGFRAVCWTDFLQALLMVGTLVIFPVYLLIVEGGYGFIAGELRADDPRLLEFTPDVPLLAFIGFLFGYGALGINFGYPGQPHVLVRFMALRDRREVYWTGAISFFWGLCVYWGAVTVGLMARAMTQAGVERELLAFALVYNAICTVRTVVAVHLETTPARVSLVDVLRLLRHGLDRLMAMAAAIVVNPDRPGRVQPRVVKRRPLQYSLMTRPRGELKRELMQNQRRLT